MYLEGLDTIPHTDSEETDSSDSDTEDSSSGSESEVCCYLIYKRNLLKYCTCLMFPNNFSLISVFSTD